LIFRIFYGISMILFDWFLTFFYLVFLLFLKAKLKIQILESKFILDVFRFYNPKTQGHF